MIGLHKTLKSIIVHPYNRGHKLNSLKRFIFWQISQSLFPQPVIFPISRNSKIVISRGMTGATGCIYYGLTEFNDIMFALHLLRSEDYFVDVGSNVGVYSILLGCEKSCSVTAIEPIPTTFAQLVQNIRLNEIEEFVTAKNIGLSDTTGNLFFTSNKGTTNHVLTNQEAGGGLRVEVDTLDKTVERCPTLIKIDVEGYETKILTGATKTLDNPLLKAVIVETNGSGCRYGFPDGRIEEILKRNRFKCFKYNPVSRNLTRSEMGESGNSIFIRDLEFVKNRLESCEKIEIGKQKF